MFRQALNSTARSLRATRHLPAATNRAALLRARWPAQSAPATVTGRIAQPSVSRWYSDAKPAEEKPSEEEAKPEEAAAEVDPLAEMKKQLEAKEAEARDWKDKCLRTVADFRNLQDRTQREVKTARDFALQKFAKDLMDSVDNLDRALTTVPAEKLNVAEKSEAQQDLFNLHEGLKMTETILLQTLSKHGVEKVDPEGDKFNPNEHEATFMAPQPDKEDGLVFHVQQKGFKLNGRVLRAAKVGVVKNK